MFLRLLGESLRRGLRRKLLAAFAVALGAVGSTAVAEILLASGDRLAADLATYGANLELHPQQQGMTLAEADLARLRKIFWRNNLAAYAPMLAPTVRFSSASNAPRNGASGVVAPLVGTWFDRTVDADLSTGLPAVRPTLVIGGRWPADEEAEEGTPEIAIGRRLAARLGVSLPLVEPVTVQAELGQVTRRFTIVGIVQSGGEEEEQAFAPLSSVQALAGLPGRFERAEIFAVTTPEPSNAKDPRRMTPKEYDAWYCTAYPSAIAHQIGEAIPSSRAVIVRGITEATSEVLGRLRAVLAVLALVALFGAALGVAAAMTATVLERRLEAGLFAALGAPREQIAFFFLIEAALIGTVGGLVGGALGLVLGRLLGVHALGVEVDYAPILVPLAGAAGLVLAALASLPPIVRALERDPALLLKKASA